MNSVKYVVYDTILDGDCIKRKMIPEIYKDE